MASLKERYDSLSRRAKIGLVSGAVLVPAVLMGGPGSPATAPMPSTTPQSQPAPVVTHEDYQQVELIAFITETRDDATLLKGEQKLIQEGANGSKTTTWDITKQDGKEVSKVVKGDPIVKAPLNKILANGIYVAPPPKPVSNCNPNYSGYCVPNVSYDLNCVDIGYHTVKVIGVDVYKFDRDKDGLGCE